MPPPPAVRYQSHVKQTSGLVDRVMEVYEGYLQSYQEPRAAGYVPRERWTRLAAERQDGADLVRQWGGLTGVGAREVTIREVIRFMLLEICEFSRNHVFVGKIKHEAPKY